jgi:hypothetical protein
VKEDPESWLLKQLTLPCPGWTSQLRLELIAVGLLLNQPIAWEPQVVALPFFIVYPDARQMENTRFFLFSTQLTTGEQYKSYSSKSYSDDRR